MVTNRRLVENEGPDFYPTPKWATYALLLKEHFIGNVLEPCCGEGDISEMIKKYFPELNVISSDLYDRGYGAIKDIFDYKTEKFVNIITNPPFNIANQIVEHVLDNQLATQKMALLLRTAFLEGQYRYDNIFKRHAPSRVHVFSERLSMYPKGQPVKGGGTTSYAWFVWDFPDNKQTTTTIHWIEPGFKKLNDRL